MTTTRGATGSETESENGGDTRALMRDRATPNRTHRADYAYWPSDRERARTSGGRETAVVVAAAAAPGIIMYIRHLYRSGEVGRRDALDQLRAGLGLR